MTEPKPRPAGTFSPADLAARWGVSIDIVRRLIRSGELRGFRLGPRLMRVSIEALENYEQHRAIAEEPEPMSPQVPTTINEKVIGAALRYHWRREMKRTSK